MNDEAVYRTALATPGLLNIVCKPTSVVFFFTSENILATRNKNNYNKTDIMQGTRTQVPLYFLTVYVGQRAARTLGERFRSKNYDFTTQFTYVSTHHGT